MSIVPKPPTTLEEVLDERDELHGRAMKQLEHLPRDYAMSIVLAWIPTDELRKIVEFWESKK